MRRVFIVWSVVAFVGAFAIPLRAEAATNAGGVLASDTTWTVADSPYIVTSTVQIPQGVTLTIEPGVRVEASSGLQTMFLVHGTLRAIGTESSRIEFNGAGSADFFSAKSSPDTMLVHVEHANIEKGRSLWPPTGFEQYGHLILRHSRVSDLSYYSYIWYPQEDVFIEYNTFINSPGFSIGHRDADVYVRWNRFVSLGSGFSAFPAWITNWASYGSSRTFVNNNVFGAVPTGKYVLYLPPGYSDAAMDGTSNYWGTTDPNVVAARIFDRNDDITAAGVIPYDPLLNTAPSDVPPEPIPSPSASTAEPGPAVHEMSVSLTLRKGTRLLVASGFVSVQDGFATCLEVPRVNVQRLVRREWKTMRWGYVVDEETGAYRLGTTDKPGKYRVLIDQQEIGNPATDVCTQAVSPTRVR
jgi:hypothetical protein